MKDSCESDSKLSSLITDPNQGKYHKVFIWLQMHLVTCVTHCWHHHMYIPLVKHTPHEKNEYTTSNRFSPASAANETGF